MILCKIFIWWISNKINRHSYFYFPSQQQHFQFTIIIFPCPKIKLDFHNNAYRNVCLNYHSIRIIIPFNLRQTKTNLQNINYLDTYI